MTLKCQQCGTAFKGRSDKKYCSMACKNAWHSEQRRDTQDAVAEIDGYLHRNRQILALLMGNATKVQLDRLVLTRTGFKYEYHTGTYLNKEGKMYRIVYDYAWMDFSNQQVLVIKKSSKNT